jgi:hypothetical protein
MKLRGVSPNSKTTQNLSTTKASNYQRENFRPKPIFNPAIIKEIKEKLGVKPD